MRFKEYLNEAVKAGFAPWHERDVAKIHQLLYHELSPRSKHWIITNSPYKINKSGTVSVKNPYMGGAELAGIGGIPSGVGFKWKYSSVDVSSLNIKNDYLTSIWGAPDKVDGDFLLASHSLKTFDHLITKCTSQFKFKCPHLETFGDCLVTTLDLVIGDMGKTLGFKDMYKHFNVTNNVYIDIHAVEKLQNKGVLGLVQWSEHSTKPLYFCPRNNFDRDTEVGKVLKIVKDGIHDGNDMLDIQDELAAAGYKEYAKL